MKYLIFFIYIIISDYIFFGLTAYFKGKKFNHDCKLCDNWACTHNTKYQDKGFYPVRDWYNWCQKGCKHD